MRNTAVAFRHQPTKSVLEAQENTSRDCDWRFEPALSSHKAFTYYNRTKENEIAVPLSATPAIIEGVGVIVASDDGYVRLLDETLRKVYWERRLNSSIYASLVVDHDRRTVVVCSTTGLVCCLNLKGRLIWSREVGHPIFATPAPHGPTDSLVIAAFNQKCICLALSDGAERYQADLPPPWYVNAGLVGHRNPYASPVVDGSGRAFLCSGEIVTSLDAEGALRWQSNVGGEIKASPILDEEQEQLVVQSVDGTVSFMKCADGELISSFKVGAKLIASGAIHESVIAIGTATGDMIGIDKYTRKPLWVAAAQGPRDYTSITVTPNGNFLTTSERGNLVCVDATGQFVWESSQVTGQPNHEPRIDITPAISRRHLYAASYTGNLYRFSPRPKE